MQDKVRSWVFRSALSLLPLQDRENLREVVENILSFLKSTVGNRVERGMVRS